MNGSAVKDLTESDNHSNHICHDATTSPRGEPILSSYKPSCSSTPTNYSSPHKSCSDLDQDSHSLTSQDSGIPTLEINPPEPILHGHQQPCHGGMHNLHASDGPPATLSLDDNLSSETIICKSSTFPRSSYDSIRLFSPGLRMPTTTGLGIGALNRSDDISVCSVSSMSTEFSVSNEDILDFTVTSDSSAIVTLETDESGSAAFSDVTLSSSPVLSYMGSGITQQEEHVTQKKPSPLLSLFNRYVWILP